MLLSAAELLPQLNGLRVLVAEDEYVIATDISEELRERGAIVVGPAATIDRAMDLTHQPLDMALLDINLRGQLIFPVAETLLDQGVPFVFSSGYAQSMIPQRFSHVRYIDKPLNIDQVLDALSAP